MGWDVVQIGLKHNLPVHDMHATARELSRRLNRNLRLNICDEYVYSKESHSIKSVPGWENYVEVDRYVIDDSNVFVNLVACNYQAKQLYQEIGAEGFLSLSFEDEMAKHILFHTDDGEYPLYELYYKDDDGNDVEIRLFKENVDLDFYVKEKWLLFAEAFSMECESDRLLEIRNKVLEQAKLFGCEEIVYCPDQGPGEYIFSKIFLPSDTLKDYILSKRYLLEYFDCDKVEYEDWLKDARYIDYQSYFDNGPMIAPGEFIEVIFDKVIYIMKAIYNCDNHNFPEWIKENASADEIIFRGVMPFEEACAINPIVDCLKGKIVDITDYDISYPVDDDPCANFEEFFFGYIYWSSYYDMLWTVICANKQFATRYVMSLDKPYVLSEDGRVYLQYKLFSSIVIPSSVRVIGHFSFYHIEDTNWCNIVLPDQLEIVGDLALNGLDQIDSLPDSIREIGAYAFEHVMEYKHFSIPSHIKVIPEGCFRSSDVGRLGETIIVPEGVEKIEFNAFELHSDSSIHFPSTLKDLDTCFHYNEPVYPNEPPYIEVDERNPYFYAVDGTLYKRGEEAPYLGVKYKRYEED